MSDTNITKNPDFVHIGPAVLKFYDEENDWLVDLGKVSELILRKTVEKLYMTSVFNGVMVQERGQSVAESWELQGKFGETLDPNTQYLTFKNCGTPSVTDECVLTQITELLQVFSSRCRTLTMNKGFYGISVLPPPVGVVGNNIAAPPGTFNPGDYDISVVAEYAGGGTSIAITAVPVTMGAADTLVVVITPPTGATPESYSIYIDAPGDIGPTLWLNTTSLNVFFTAPITGGADLPADGTTSFTVTNEAGTVTYAVDTDYTIDISCAGLCVLPDGDICDGQYIKITYSYTRDPEAVISLGPSDRIPKLAHPVIIAFKNDSRSTPAARGVEIHLWKTDFDFGFEWDLSSLNFESGFAFTVPVLFSESDLNFGEVTTLSERFECYGLKDLRALTQFSQNVDCETEVS